MPERPDCNDGLGNDVYECIEYEDAKEIDEGEYRDVKVCCDCLYKYHYGETG